MISKCTKCSSFSFELVEQSPVGSNYKLFFVQCSMCGGPVGVLEYFSSNAQIGKVAKQIENLERKIDQIDYLLRQSLSRR